MCILVRYIIVLKHFVNYQNFAFGGPFADTLKTNYMLNWNSLPQDKTLRSEEVVSSDSSRPKTLSLGVVP